jgi:hypothetical protein
MGDPGVDHVVSDGLLHTTILFQSGARSAQRDAGHSYNFFYLYFIEGGQPTRTDRTLVMMTEGWAVAVGMLGPQAESTVFAIFGLGCTTHSVTTT